MTDHERDGAPPHLDTQNDDPTNDLLLLQATRAALGAAPQDTPPELASLLERCPTCRDDLSELTELTRMAYSGQVEPSTEYPKANLSFLDQSQPRRNTQPPLVKELGRLIIVFTEALITSLQQPSLAGAARGELMYRYIQEPGPMRVTIEVYAETPVSPTGRVQVNVDIDSRDPFEQHGTQVLLRAGEVTWQGETDQTGYVDFTAVPLSALPGLRVEVTPTEEESMQN
jgi:hypothetical protein